MGYTRLTSRTMSTRRRPSDPFVWAFFFIAANALALDPSKSVAHYSLDSWAAREGLPQNSVMAVLQTRDGYLWFGTEEGVVRFDGATFTVYSKRNTPAFSENVIEALEESRDGSLWIGTDDGLLRKQGESFTAYHVKDGLPNESITALLAEPDGSLWIGTQGGGLGRWSHGRFEPALTKSRGLPDDDVLDLAPSRDGSIWVGTSNGFAHLRGGDLVTYATSAGLPSRRINTILETAKGELWVGTAAGLVRFENGRASAVLTTREGLPNNNVNSLLEDRDRSIWVATSGGLARLRDGRVEALTTAGGLPSEVVLSLGEDREGNLWVGTDSGGLVRLRNSLIVTYTRRDGLTNDFIRPVLEDAQGTLWVGTRAGLNRFRDGRFSALTTRDGLPGDSISALLQARDGALWVGTSGAGIARWEKGRVRVYSERDGLASNMIRVLLEDRRGRIWIGTNGGGLNRLENGAITTLSTADGLVGGTVNALCEDTEGALWIGTTTGLSRWKDGAFTSYTTRDGLSSDSIRFLRSEEDGTLWIGTSGGGLIRLRQGRFASVSARQGLFDDVVFGILDDGHGNFWMSCNRGIFRVARQELEEFFGGRATHVTSTAFGEADGMRSAECNGSFQPAGWRSRDGRLWFPTIRGLVRVDPTSVAVNLLPPPVVIEKVAVNGREIALGSSLDLPPGSRSLELHYAGLSLVAPARVRFKYRLEGLDSDWVDADTRRTAYYTNLRPGRYVFRVIACNSDGVWNSVGAKLPLAIRPRFTETPYFWGLCAVTLLAAAGAAYRFRVQRLQTRARELEAGIREAMSNIRVLRGLFPICASCKKIRDDQGYWKQIESYIHEHSEAEFSHSICPECMKRLYPDFADEVAREAAGDSDVM